MLSTVLPHPPSARRVQQESLRSLDSYDNQVVAETGRSESAEGDGPCPSDSAGRALEPSWQAPAPKPLFNWSVL